MKKLSLLSGLALSLAAPLAMAGTTTVAGAAAAGTTASSAVFQALAAGDAQALFALAQTLFGASPDPNTGAITTPVVFIEGIGNATVTISPDGEITVNPVDDD